MKMQIVKGTFIWSIVTCAILDVLYVTGIFSMDIKVHAYFALVTSIIAMISTVVLGNLDTSNHVDKSLDTKRKAQ